MDETTVEISFIVPVYNEEQTISDIVNDLIASGAGRSVEVLVVDGGSQDGTRARVRELAADNVNVRLLDNPLRITPAALNLGIEAAGGRIIGIMGSRCRISSDYTEQVLKTFEWVDADIVAGRTVTLPGAETAEAKAIALATSHAFGRGGAAYLVSKKSGYVDTAAFANYKAEVFCCVGKFRLDLVRNQDNEFNYRARAAGCKIFLNTEIEVGYRNRSTFLPLWKQSYNNGKWNVRTWQLNPGSFALRHFVPCAFVLSLLLSAITGFFWWPMWPFGVAILMLYAGTATYCGLKASSSEALKLLPLIVICFFGFHLFYGFGTLAGVFLLLLGRFPKTSGVQDRGNSSRQTSDC